MTIYDSDGNSYQDLTAWHLDSPDKQDLTKEPGYNPKTDTYEKPQEGVPEPVKFLFGRHGETDDNDENRNRGQSEIPLNETGHEDAENLAQSVRDSGFDVKHIVASDLTRARQTAKHVSNAIGVPVETDPRLKAWDVGVFTGQKDTGQLEKFCKETPDEPPPGSTESFNDFKSRVMAAVGDLTNKYPEGLMLVGHNSTERTIDSTLNGTDYHADGIEPGQHKEFNIEHDSSFSKAFQSAAEAYKTGNPEEGGKQAARFGRAALTSLLGKVAGTVTGPIDAAKRIIERYEQATEALTQGKPAPEFDPAEHVTDLMQVLGALGGGLGGVPENAAAANSIKIVPAGIAKNHLGPPVIDFKILRNTPEGEVLSGDTYGSFNPRSGHLKVGWLGTEEATTRATGSEVLKTNAHAHAYKMSEIRDLIREAIKEFPDVKTIGGGHTPQQPGGGRISGAHSTSKTPQYFTVTDKMREEVLGKVKEAGEATDPLARSLRQISEENIRTGANSKSYRTLSQLEEDRLHDPYYQQNYTPEPGAFNRPQPARTLEEGVQRFQDQFRSTMEDVGQWDVTDEEIARGALSPTSADEIEAMARRWEEYHEAHHAGDPTFAQQPFAGHLLPRTAADVYNSLGVFAGDMFRYAYRREATPENVADFEDILHIEAQPGGSLYSRGSKEASVVSSLKEKDLNLSPSDIKAMKDYMDKGDRRKPGEHPRYLYEKKYRLDRGLR